jgi:AcrR family transcriptional regulator
VQAAIDILDAEGSDDSIGLTLRNVMARLDTGSGAIYHHVATMDELRAAAGDEVLRAHFESISTEAEPNDALRATAGATFEAIRAHPWLGAQLTRTSIQPAVFRIWKSIGSQLARLHLHGAAAATAGSTLANFVLGSMGDFGANLSQSSDPLKRQAHLGALAQEWLAVDGDDLVAEIALQVREHDDFTQFMDGVDIILEGIATHSWGLNPPPQ